MDTARLLMTEGANGSRGGYSEHESACVIFLDLLPDRTADTSAAWMVAHPELEIVSRDRGGDYAAAARKAAPQATQIADRFHMFVRRLT
jgi:transposase